jgi:hypothetical protein
MTIETPTAATKDLRLMKILLLCFVVVYHVYLIFSISHEPWLLQDSREYLNGAQHFITNGNYYAGNDNGTVDYRLFSKRTPLYPVLLSVFISNHLHIHIIYVFQVFLGLFNILLFYLLLKLIVPNQRKPLLIGSVFIFLTPAQFIYSQFIMADLLLQTFVMIVVLSFLYFHKTKDILWLGVVVLSATLGALTKPVFLPISLIVGLYALFIIIKSKRISFWIIVALLPFISWFYLSKKNEKLTGVFHYSSITYMNLLHYNTNLYLNNSVGKEETEKILGKLMIVPESKVEFVKNYKEVNSVCASVLLNNIFSYSIYHSRGVAYYFLDPGRFDLYNFLRLENENSNGFLHRGAGKNKFEEVYSQYPSIAVVLVFLLLINIIKTLGFIGFLWVRRKDFQILLIGGLVFYLAILTGPLGASRFALPSELIIIAFASIYFKEKFGGKKTENV